MSGEVIAPIYVSGCTGVIQVRNSFRLAGRLQEEFGFLTEPANGFAGGSEAASYGCRQFPKAQRRLYCKTDVKRQAFEQQLEALYRARPQF